jgi:hypothetical protein
MAHEIAKLLLEKADTFIARAEAIKAAMDLKMPLHAIEEYLDWLDRVRGMIPSNGHAGDADSNENRSLTPDGGDGE